MSARREKLIVALLLQAGIGTTFVVLGRALQHQHQPDPAWLVTPLDRALPVIPATVWAYISWYPAPLLLLWTARGEFRRAAAATALAFVLCALGYVWLPVSITRPSLAGDGVSERMLLLLYAADPPWNLFPSFHAALCTIMCRLVLPSARGRWIVGLWMAGICIACVLTKQHFVLDVLAGLAVGAAASWLVRRVASDAPELRPSRAVGLASAPPALPAPPS
jgi:membrane-associated phospholipid phosphatase